MIRVLELSFESIREAAEVVSRGGLIIYPTDTVYGLGCDPMNESSVKRVYEVKRRRDKPLPILGSSIEALSKICSFNDLSIKLAKRFWPGALTIVLPSRVKILANLYMDSIAVRIPNHREVLELIRLCGGLLVGTSANISGMPSPKSVSEAVKQIGGGVDLAIDGGILPGKPSTIIDLTKPKPMVLREGPLSVKEIFECLE